MDQKFWGPIYAAIVLLPIKSAKTINTLDAMFEKKFLNKIL